MLSYNQRRLCFALLVSCLQPVISQCPAGTSGPDGGPSLLPVNPSHGLKSCCSRRSPAAARALRRQNVQGGWAPGLPMPASESTRKGWLEPSTRPAAKNMPLVSSVQVKGRSRLICTLSLSLSAIPNAQTTDDAAQPLVVEARCTSERLLFRGSQPIDPHRVASVRFGPECCEHPFP